MPDPLKKQVRMFFAPFEFMWPNRSVSVVRETGLLELPIQIADAAIAAGMAEAVDKVSRSRRSRSTARDAAPSVQADENSLASEPDSMDRADLAGDGGTDGVLPDQEAGER